MTQGRSKLWGSAMRNLFLGLWGQGDSGGKRETQERLGTAGQGGDLRS